MPIIPDTKVAAGEGTLRSSNQTEMLNKILSKIKRRRGDAYQ